MAVIIGAYYDLKFWIEWKITKNHENHDKNEMKSGAE